MTVLLNNWNGVSFFYDESFVTSVSLNLFTSAAPSIGFGGSLNNDWFADTYGPAKSSTYEIKKLKL